MLPYLEEKDPEIVKNLGSVFDQYSQQPEEALQEFLQGVNHRFGQIDFPEKTESLHRLSIDRLLDF